MDSLDSLYTHFPPLCRSGRSQGQHLRLRASPVGERQGAAGGAALQHRDAGLAGIERLAGGRKSDARGDGSTGVYWKPVWNVLEDRLKVMVVNARHIKQVPGRKTDVKDCQ